jgi:hypothetical protein
MLRDMTDTAARRSELERVIRAVDPLDELEAGHQANALEWVHAADEIYRTRKPDVPPKHLVAYWNEVHAAPPNTVDPHLPRFVTKLQRDLAR